jgi:hypothetical protein
VAAVAGDAHVTGDHALNDAVRAEDHVDYGEAWIDLDAERLSLLGKPATQADEAPGIAAVVAHQRRHEDVRHAEAAGLPQIVEAVLADLCCERRVLVAPIRDELVEADRIDHRARQDVRADLRPLLEDDDGELLGLLRGELLEPDSRGKASGSGADDDDVEFHGLAFNLAPCRHLAQFFAPNLAGTKGLIPAEAGIQYR